MKRTKFTETQIISALKKMQDGISPKIICREIGVHQQTLYDWKSKYGGMEVSDLSEMKRLKEENRRLKTIVADLTLDNQMLKDLNSRKW